MSVRDAMVATSLTDDYRPPYYLEGKESMITYWVRDPETRTMRRIKEKLNWVKDLKQRRLYAAKRVADIGLRLSIGWNPLRDKDVPVQGVVLEKALDMFVEGKERDGLSRHSMRSYRSYCSILKQWLILAKREGRMLSAFDKVCARTFLQHRYLEGKLTADSYNNNVQFYITLWNWFIETGLATTSPFAGIKRKDTDPDKPSKRRAPTLEERQRIRAYLQKRDPRFFTFSLLIFHCGIRPNELFQLKPENFHLSVQSITIPGTISKNGRTQGVAIPDTLLPHLLALKMEKQRPDHFVFSTDFRPGAKQCDSRDSGRAWTKLRQAIGLKQQVSNYTLKHAGATQLSQDGIGEVDLMNHLRHHDLAETSIYTRATYEGGVRSVVTKASEF
jgi:integrase